MDNLMPLIQAIHGLAATIWIGGIFFAYMALRPAAVKTLEPIQRLNLWQSTFSHFFRWVWLCIGLLLVTGYIDLFIRFNGLNHSQTYLTIMHITGLLMTSFFLYLYFGLYRNLRQALSNNSIEIAASIMNKMRPVIATNLSLGIFITLVGISGSML